MVLGAFVESRLIGSEDLVQFFLIILLVNLWILSRFDVRWSMWSLERNLLQLFCADWDQANPDESPEKKSD